MKKKLLLIIRILAFSVLLALSVGAAYKVVAWKDTTGDYLSSVKQLYATGEDLIDVAFVGSSHVYAGIYPNFLWEEYGIAAFDMSISGQDKDSSYHSVVELCKTQSPKVVCIDMYGITFDEHAVEGNIYRNYLSLPTSINSIRLVRDYVEKEEQADFIFRWPIVHTRYRELKKYDFVNYAPNEFGRGAYFDWQSMQIDEAFIRTKDCGKTALSEKNQKWIDELYELSEKENFELIFILIPYSNYDVDDEMQLAAAKEYAEAKGISYYDFRDELYESAGFDAYSDFLDINHLNGYGAEKLTKYIGANILSSYKLPDHSEEALYDDWDMDSKWYAMSKAKYYMRTTPDAYGLFDLIYSDQDFTAIISLEGNAADFTMDYWGILQSLGIPYEEVIKGGKWLIRDGKITKIMENETGNEYVLTLSGGDTLRVTYVEDFTARNVMLDKEWRGSAGTFMGVTIYDEFLGEYVMTRGF